MYILQVSTTARQTPAEGHRAVFDSTPKTTGMFATDYLWLSYEASCVATLAIIWPNANCQLPTELTHPVSRPTWAQYRPVAEVTRATCLEAVIAPDELWQVMLMAILHYARVYELDGLCALVSRPVLEWLNRQSVSLTVSGFSFPEALRCGRQLATFPGERIYVHLSVGASLAILVERPLFDQLVSTLTTLLVA